MGKEQVFGYVRVSTQTQVVKGNGIDSQTEDIKRYCREHDLELVHIYRDKGISGTVSDRPELTDMLASFNGVKKVVVQNTSRLWRDEDNARILIKRALKHAGADIISVEQPTYSVYNEDPSQNLINGFMELLDEYDRMCVNLKLAKGRKAKARKGMKSCGVAPIGYTWDKNANIIVDEEYGDIVKDIFKQYLKLGSISKVKAHLDEQEIYTPRGNVFSKQAIADILSNPIYKGDITYGDISATGKHAPLVSKQTFGKVQSKLSENRRNHG